MQNVEGRMQKKTARGQTIYSFCFSEILRFVARLPLDVAADARLLGWCKSLAGQHGIEGFTQIFSRHRQPVARAAFVELAAINEPMLLVEKKKVRRAGGAIRFGDGLSRIVKVREIVTGGLGFQ